MTKLKLGPIADDKPIKVTLELPASLHRDLTAYAENALAYRSSLSFLSGRINTLTRAIKGE